MYLKKEIIISFFIITISASNLYMPMIWLYVFLQDFLIPFFCDPDLQCTSPLPTVFLREVVREYLASSMDDSQALREMKGLSGSHIQ